MVNKYFENAKKSIEQFFDGKCNIYNYEEVRNFETGVSNFEEILKQKDIPCRIVYKKINSAGQGRVSDYLSQSIVLILPTNVVIPEGSKIFVTSQNINEFYQKSGSPAFYKTHQEIPLIIFKGFA